MQLLLNPVRSFFVGYYPWNKKLNDEKFNKACKLSEAAIKDASQGGNIPWEVMESTFFIKLLVRET